MGLFRTWPAMSFLIPVLLSGCPGDFERRRAEELGEGGGKDVVLGREPPIAAEKERPPPGREVRVAEASLEPVPGQPVSGTVTFVERGDDVVLHVEARGLEHGHHALAIHEEGDCGGPAFLGAGDRMIDLPDLEVPRGAHEISKELGTSRLDFDGSGLYSAMGRSVILYRGDPSEGERIACGVIRSTEALIGTPRPPRTPGTRAARTGR